MWTLCADRDEWDLILTGLMRCLDAIWGLLSPGMFSGFEMGWAGANEKMLLFDHLGYYKYGLPMDRDLMISKEYQDM